jgi:DNA-binding transcriptional regulator PaaX
MKKQQHKLNKRRKQKIYHTVGTVQKYTTLLEQFKNVLEKIKETETTSQSLTYVYITIQYPGLMQALK